MSLIQEALRRQNEDGDGPDGTPPGPSATPPPKAAGKLTLKHAAPSDDAHATDALSDLPPMPDDPSLESDQHEEGQDKKRVVKLVVLAVLLIAVAVAGAAAWYFMSPKPTAAAASTTPVSAPVPVESASTPAEPVSPEPADSVVSETDSTSSTASSESATDSASVDELPEEEISMWPSLTVSGTAGIGSKSSAFINKQLVRVGDSIDGVKVLAIDMDSVDLEYNGEKQTVNVGKSTR